MGVPGPRRRADAPEAVDAAPATGAGGPSGRRSCARGRRFGRAVGSATRIERRPEDAPPRFAERRVAARRSPRRAKCSRMAVISASVRSDRPAPGPPRSLGLDHPAGGLHVDTRSPETQCAAAWAPDRPPRPRPTASAPRRRWASSTRPDVCSKRQRAPSLPTAGGEDDVDLPTASPGPRGWHPSPCRPRHPRDRSAGVPPGVRAPPDRSSPVRVQASVHGQPDATWPRSASTGVSNTATLASGPPRSFGDLLRADPGADEGLDLPRAHRHSGAAVRAVAGRRTAARSASSMASRYRMPVVGEQHVPPVLVDADESQVLHLSWNSLARRQWRTAYGVDPDSATSRPRCAPQPRRPGRVERCPSPARPVFDACVVLCPSGGPKGPEEVLPFLRRVTAGRGIPDERLAEVAAHYALFGGVSPINAQNRALVAALGAELDRPRPRPAGRPRRTATPRRSSPTSSPASSPGGASSSSSPAPGGPTRPVGSTARTSPAPPPASTWSVDKVPPYADHPAFVAIVARLLGDGDRPCGPTHRRPARVPAHGRPCHRPFRSERVLTVAHSVPIGMDAPPGLAAGLAAA